MIEKILLKPKTCFSEMFSSDQLWGQMIWAISDLYGNDVASEAVAEFLDKPPFIISSLLIDGFLPKPLYVDIIGDLDSAEHKHNKKLKNISYEDFRRLQLNPMAFSSEEIHKRPRAFSSIDEIHASISRDSLKVSEGGLFNSSYIWTDELLCFYISYNSMSDGWNKKIDSILSYFEKTGLGGDKNTGHGQFDISRTSVSNIEKEIFDFKSSDFFISLSDCSGQDLVPVSYSLDVYSGISGRVIGGAYRKKPVVRFKSGSLFLDGTGSIVRNTGSDSSCSYGLAFPVYMTYNEEVKA